METTSRRPGRPRHAPYTVQDASRMRRKLDWVAYQLRELHWRLDAHEELADYLATVAPDWYAHVRKFTPPMIVSCEGLARHLDYGQAVKPAGGAAGKA